MVQTTNDTARRPLRRMTTFAPRAAVVALMALMVTSAPARAIDWVDIDLKGVTFHMPSTGTDAEDIHIGKIPTDIRERISVAAYLKDRQEADSRIAGWNAVAITLPPRISGRLGKFLDHFDRSDVLPAMMSITVGERATHRCEYDKQFWDRDRERARNGENQVEGGWSKFKFGKSPEKTLYVKPVVNASQPENIDSVSCNSLGMCYVNYCLNLISVDYNFYFSAFDMSEWPKLIDNTSEAVKTVVGADFWDRHR